MFEVSYEATFSAIHRLTEAGHPIEPLHGHDWRVEVTAAGHSLDAVGVVIDFEVLKKALHEVTGALQHRDLNEHPAFRHESPSAEAVARFIFGELRRALGEKGALLRRVRTFEAPGCSATYYE